MSTITLPNIRVSSDLTVKVRLKDGGVAIDWSTLSNIKACIYSDAQRALAGRCAFSIDEEDNTLLVCTYAANKPQYLGVNRIVISAKYMGETKTYDKPAFTFVRWTADQEGEEITIDDPDVDVEITVEDVSSSILQEAVDAAFSAADRANEAAEEAEHMVDIHTGPAGKSPYIGENGHWYEWDEETHQYVDTETNAKGDTGETPDISIGTVTTVEPGTPAAASMGGTPEAPVLNLSIPKGAVGATPNFTVGTVTTGQPGTPVVITITGTAEAPVLNITIPQGLKGDTGVSADYPITIHNGLDSDATDEALAAAQGKILDGKVSQLEAEVSDLSLNVQEEGFFLVDPYMNIGAAFTGGQLITPTKYYGKKFSFLGDSMTTFGVPDQNNATGTWTYPGNRCRYPQADLLTNVSLCWWKRLIDKLGATLGINESWAGSRVSNTQATDSGDLGPNRCISSLTRIGHLDDNGTPDYILVYAGANDAGNDVEIGTFDTTNPATLTEQEIAALPVATFADAFRALLIRLLYYYPTSKVIVLFPNFTNTYYSAGELDNYVEMERTACDFFGVPWVDLRTAGITVYNKSSLLPDGLHANAAGMELMCNLVYNYLMCH